MTCFLCLYCANIQLMLRFLLFLQYYANFSYTPIADFKQSELYFRTF
nr:MAG TPA: hypothetical protein [Bacteriophage sp.]